MTRDRYTPLNDVPDLMGRSGRFFARLHDALPFIAWSLLAAAGLACEVYEDLARWMP